MKLKTILQILFFCVCTYLVFCGLEWLIDQNNRFLTMIAVVNLAAWALIGVVTHCFTKNPFRKQKASAPLLTRKEDRTYTAKDNFLTQSRIRPRPTVPTPPAPPPNRKIGSKPTDRLSESSRNRWLETESSPQQEDPLAWIRGNLPVDPAILGFPDQSTSEVDFGGGSFGGGGAEGSYDAPDPTSSVETDLGSIFSNDD